MTTAEILIGLFGYKPIKLTTKIKLQILEHNSISVIKEKELMDNGELFRYIEIYIFKDESKIIFSSLHNSFNLGE